MKKIFSILLSVTIVITGNAQGIGIGTNTPNNSAMLDITSTSKGFLTPRMTSVQRGAIVSPANGLLVYDITTSSFWYYNGGAWANLAAPAQGSGSGWGLTGNTGTTAATNFIGTSDDQSLQFKVNNQRFGWLDKNNSVFFGASAGQVNTAYGNIAIGSKALFNNTVIPNLVAIGDSALYNNGVGVSDLASAINNIGIGSKALYSNKTGSHNTAIGYRSQMKNELQWNNTSLGASTLTENLGTLNTAIGAHSL